MIDFLIRGDRVVTLNGTGAWDVAISGERVAAVVAPGVIPERDAARVIDARGKIVVPGGIDPHIHCKFPIVGYWSALPEPVSRAALFGGTTTLIDFAIWSQGQTLRQTLENRDADCWRGQCYCDYGFHIP
jgi:dihydropyrimidinase